MLYHFIIIVLGFLSSYILFFKFPMIKSKAKTNSQHIVSIIIPARNEEKNIQLLLQDLICQTINIHEIICVDDGSTDNTYEVAASFGVKMISIKDKPSDWTGKAWACQTGAELAVGDILIFLDADVRLGRNAISSLIHLYDVNRCVISVQPYHRTEKFHEQFSFFFNLIQIAGNGLTIVGDSPNIGLYGPVILFAKDTYISIDGHLAAQRSIVDDVVLGEKLKKMGFPFKLFMGGENILFRMYANNLKSLFQGWTKNYATGAFKADTHIFGLVFLWVASSLDSVIFLIRSLVDVNKTHIIIALTLYIFWIIELFRISNKIGKFKRTTIIFFPVYLIFFVLVFLVSLFKKIFNMEVVWKDRKIKLEK